MYVTRRDGKDTFAVPPDRTVTGFSGTGKRTSFHDQSNRSVTLRNIESREIYWLCLAPLMASGISWFLIGNLYAERSAVHLSVMIGPLWGITVLLALMALRHGQLIWKEILITAGVGFSLHDPARFQGTQDLAALVVALVAIGAYAHQWRSRALWEPCIAVVLLFVVLFAIQLVPVPLAVAMIAFFGISLFGFWASGMIALEALQYSERLGNYTINND